MNVYAVYLWVDGGRNQRSLVIQARDKQHAIEIATIQYPEARLDGVIEIELADGESYGSIMRGAR